MADEKEETARAQFGETTRAANEHDEEFEDEDADGEVEESIEVD